jgi:hypothetical protein
LIGFENRLLVLLQWAYAYFTFERGARLITGHPNLEARPRVRPARAWSASVTPRTDFHWPRMAGLGPRRCARPPRPVGHPTDGPATGDPHQGRAVNGSSMRKLRAPEGVMAVARDAALGLLVDG